MEKINRAFKFQPIQKSALMLALLAGVVTGEPKCFGIIQDQAGSKQADADESDDIRAANEAMRIASTAEQSDYPELQKSMTKACWDQYVSQRLMEATFQAINASMMGMDSPGVKKVLDEYGIDTAKLQDDAADGSLRGKSDEIRSAFLSKLKTDELRIEFCRSWTRESESLHKVVPAASWK
ncbi:MAG: hypothetical protein R3C03_16450 [Pirellulaceae bacterium]